MVGTIKALLEALLRKAHKIKVHKTAFLKKVDQKGAF